MNELFNTRTRMSIFNGFVECMLNEGLISSYDIQKLQNNLKQKFNNIKIVNPTELEFKNHNFNYKAYSFVINVENNKEVENKLSKVNEKDFTVFKIAYDDNYDYYLDEFTTVKNMDIVACFVLKNIPPNKLEIVK